MEYVERNQTSNRQARSIVYWGASIAYKLLHIGEKNKWDRYTSVLLTLGAGYERDI
jgi:hypothetical protein